MPFAPLYVPNPPLLSTPASAATLTLTYDSSPSQVITGTNIHTVAMPSTGIIAGGFPWTITNKSTGIVTINASGGGVIGKLEPKATVVLQANAAAPTTAAGWSIVGGTSFLAGQIDPNSAWSQGNAEPFSRQNLSANGLATQIAEFAYFNAPVANTITKLGISVVASGGSSGITLSRLGLYTVAANGDLTMVARTANVTTLGATADSLNSSALDATGGYVTSYTFIPGQRYAFGVLQVGTTPSNIVVNFLNTGPNQITPYLVGRLFSQTDLPTTATAANLASGWYKIPYVVGLV